MANIKISNLEQTNITNPGTSFVMVVAQDENSGLYRNYRISLNELRRIIGSIEGDIVTGVTETQVREIVNNAILADNDNELTEAAVQEMINDSISRIELPSTGVSEERVNTLIQTAISEDNRNELTQAQVIQLIKANTPTQTLNETRVNELITLAISTDNQNELQESRVQEMINTSIEGLSPVEPGLSAEEIQGIIDASITTDNLKDHIETVVPDVVPSIVPEVQLEVNHDVLDEPVNVTIQDIAQTAVVNQVTINKLNETVETVHKTISEECVCDEHADDCFNSIFK
jgi:hypothetical protein